MIKKLKHDFGQYTDHLKDLATKDLSKSFGYLKQLESILLLFEIRGVKVLSYVMEKEIFNIQYEESKSKLDVINHMTDVLNKKKSAKDDIKIDIVDDIRGEPYIESSKEPYCFENYNLPKTLSKNNRQAIKAKLNTNANSYHLISSIMAVCDDTDDDLEGKKQYRVYDLNYKLPLIRRKPARYQHQNNFLPTNLNSKILSLQNCNFYQNLLGGKIRVAPKHLRQIYRISFEVDLGLDTIGQPLAVKRFKKYPWFGKKIKNLVDQLMIIRNIYILPYFACSYDQDQLILATQLCKCSLAHYIQLIKTNQIDRSLDISPRQLLCQFLEGLLVLHKHNITHGNLKPSNIFIDFNGIVKIAEFGLFRTLYTIISAPKHCMIWFAKETLEVYQNTSIMVCSQKSDIFVAAMVICFVFTLGEHLFGNENDQILEGIRKGAAIIYPQISDLKDLILWMVKSDGRDRPSVKEILL